MLKNIFYLALILIASLFSAQVAIGKQNISSSSVSLEFYDGSDNKKGLILPWISNENVISFTPDNNLKKGGVLILDTNDKKIKISKNNGTWQDLTVHSNELVITGNTTIDTSLQSSNNYQDLPKAKAMIGGNPKTDNTPGILVLADNNKAMILPKVVSPHINIVKPSPGMLAYDPIAQQLAVFNGTVWTFWSF